MRSLMVSSLCLLLLCPGLWAEKAEIKTRVNQIDGAEMVYVPAGEFTMGSGVSGDSPEEKPAHKVYLDGYWIYRYEVTVAQYRKFCEATGRQMPPPPPHGSWQDKHPIGMVCWDDIRAYARWAGCRLPTEAEWEKAARGTDGRRYPWGNDWDPKKCNHYDSGFDPRRSTPVGSHPGGASPYGCHDMSGNVWEWCSDRWDADYFSETTARNPKGAESGNSRVIKGGSYNGWPDHYRCSVRLEFGTAETSKHWAYGFRLAADGDKTADISK